MMKYSYIDHAHANVYTHMHMPNTTSKGVEQKYIILIWTWLLKIISGSTQQL